MMTRNHGNGQDRDDQQPMAALHSTEPRRQLLSDIVGGRADSLRSQWETIEPATELAPLPAGTYIARVLSGELFTSKRGTPGFKIAFGVIEGELVGRQFWNDVWLTEAALSMAKRDLSKLGITSLDQLEQPVPPGIHCSVKLGLRRDDDGNEYNKVRSFQLIGIDANPTVDDDFAPEPSEGGSDE